VGKLADAMVELALASADAAEIEAQGGEAATLEHVEQVVDDLVVHRPAKLRMRMQHDGDRRVLFLGGLISSFQPAGGTSKDYLGHVNSTWRRIAAIRLRTLLCFSSSMHLRIHTTADALHHLSGFRRKGSEFSPEAAPGGPETAARRTNSLD